MSHPNKGVCLREARIDLRWATGWEVVRVLLASSSVIMFSPARDMRADIPGSLFRGNCFGIARRGKNPGDSVVMMMAMASSPIDPRGRR
jgi:hypothetical protein